MPRQEPWPCMHISTSSQGCATKWSLIALVKGKEMRMAQLSVCRTFLIESEPFSRKEIVELQWRDDDGVKQNRQRIAAELRNELERIQAPPKLNAASEEKSPCHKG